MLTLDWLKSQKKPRLIKLAVQGFRKHFDRKEMDLSRVNFLLGPNNAGKTSFFEALELASWMQKNGTVGGASQAAIRTALDLNPSMLNHSGPDHKTTDFSITATALVGGEIRYGDYTATAELISNNSDAVAWRYETSDSKFEIFSGSSECKWSHGMIDPGGEGAKLGSSYFDLSNAVEQMLAALNTLGLEVHPWAELRLTAKAGRDEVFVGDSGYDSQVEMPAMLRGRIASGNGYHLIFAGDNQFWLEDDSGRRMNTPDWAEFLGVDFNHFTKQDWVVVQALYEAAIEHEKHINYVVDGRSPKGNQRVMDVLANCGAEWKSKVLALGFYRGDGYFQNPYIKADLSDHEDPDIAKLGDDVVKARTVAGWNENLVGWLRAQMAGLPHFSTLWSELGPDITAGKIALSDPRIHALDWSTDLTELFQKMTAAKEDLEDARLEIWCKELERLGCDLSEFRGEMGIAPPEDEQDSSKPIQTADDVRREIEEEIMREVRDEIMGEIHDEIMGEIHDEIVRDIQNEPHADIIPDKQWWDDDPGPDPRLETTYGHPENAQSHLVGQDQKHRLWNDGAFKSKGKEGQLMDIWSAQSYMMMQPFSFELLRVKPDVAPLRGFYFDASEFPFEEIWETIRRSRAGQDDQSDRYVIRKGEKVISASLAFLGIASGFNMHWRPLMKRLELNLIPMQDDIGDMGLKELYAQSRRHPGMKRGGSGDTVVSRESVFGTLGKRVLSVDDVSRESRRDSYEQLEALGRGSRLVLQSIMAMFEASLRPSPTLVILEEPSAFLHPSLASKFTDVLRFAAEQFDVQVIVETHNEYMVRQLQTSRIKGEDLLDVTVHYFDGESGDVTRLLVEESGRIDPPIPEGFLDKSQSMMREQARMQFGQNEERKGPGNVG